MDELIVTIKIKDVDKWADSEKTPEGLERFKDEISMGLDHLLIQEDLEITIQAQDKRISEYKKGSTT